MTLFRYVAVIAATTNIAKIIVPQSMYEPLTLGH
jgi:hypothetical protein